MNTLIKKTFLGSLLLTIGFFGYVQMAQAEIEECSTQDEIDDATFDMMDLIDKKETFDELDEKMQSDWLDQKRQVLYQLEKSKSDVEINLANIKLDLEEWREERADVFKENNEVYTTLEGIREAIDELGCNDLLTFCTDEEKIVFASLKETERELEVKLAKGYDEIKRIDDEIKPLEKEEEQYEKDLDNIEIAIQTLKDEVQKFRDDYEKAKDDYEDAKDELQLLLGMSGSPTVDELQAELARQTAAWESADCDGDGTPNGIDFYPHDPTKNEEGSTGGIVPCGAVGTDQMCTFCHLIVGIHKIIKWGIGIMFVIAIVIITIAGVMYIVSAGNESMMQAAKKALMYALVGVAIMLLAWVIVHTITGMLVGGGTTFGGVNTSDGTKTSVSFFSSYSCDGKESTPPTPSTPTPTPTTPIIPPTLPTP